MIQTGKNLAASPRSVVLSILHFAGLLLPHIAKRTEEVKISEEVSTCAWSPDPKLRAMLFVSKAEHCKQLNRKGENEREVRSFSPSSL